MSFKRSLSSFSVEELKCLRGTVLGVESKDELLELIERTIQDKEYELYQGMNAKISVDLFNIDDANILLLHANGIDNLAQLREISKEDLMRMTGITRSGFEQICWARDFFDMTSFKDIPSYTEDSMTVAKVVVKNANKCSKKYPNV